MTVADQIKILGRKIKQNGAQYDLDREAAKSAYSSNNWDKYEYFTDEDLGYKPAVVEQARFDYSLLTKFLNKGLKEEDKVEGPLKILRNIEGKTKEELKAIKNQKQVQTKVIIKDKIKSPVLKSICNHEVKNRRIDNNKLNKNLTTLENMEGSKIDCSKLVYRSDDNDYFDFT